MKIKAIFIFIVVAGFLAAIFLMDHYPFGIENEELNTDDFSLESDDGLAILVIPQDNIPGNVEMDDISITRIIDNQSEDDGYIIYELAPDGLEFEEPILLNVSYENVNDTIPLIFISSSTGVDLINNTYTEINLENNTRVVSIPLTHFSKIIFKPGHGLYKLMASARDTPCGEQVITDASFTLYLDKYVAPNIYYDHVWGYEVGGITVWEFLEHRVSICGGWSNYPVPTDNVSPFGFFGDKPTPTWVSVGETVTFQDDTFKCDKEGPDKISYSLIVGIYEMLPTYYRNEEQYLAGNGTTSELDILDLYTQEVGVNIKVNCLAEVIDEDPNTDPSTVPGTNQGTDPGGEPEVEVSVNTIVNDQGLLLRKEIFVDVDGQLNSTGRVTLSGPQMQPIIQELYIGESGHTQLTFIVYAYGEYTVIVDIEGISIEKTFWA